jgi:hypothetical protein
MTHAQINERNRAMFARFLRLGEFYTKAERYADIAYQYELSVKQTQKIILKLKAERRAK